MAIVPCPETTGPQESGSVTDIADGSGNARSIVGHCPACGVDGLFAGDGGHITCARLECPRPTAADEILADREIEHIVELGERGFKIRHPLRERLDDELMDCGLHDLLESCAGPPSRPGRYRVSTIQPDDRWLWQPLDEATRPVGTAGGAA